MIRAQCPAGCGQIVTETWPPTDHLVKSHGWAPPGSVYSEATPAGYCSECDMVLLPGEVAAAASGINPECPGCGRNLVRWRES